MNIYLYVAAWGFFSAALLLDVNTKDPAYRSVNDPELSFSGNVAVTFEVILAILGFIFIEWWAPVAGFVFTMIAAHLLILATNGIGSIKARSIAMNALGINALIASFAVGG